MFVAFLMFSCNDKEDPGLTPDLVSVRFNVSLPLEVKEQQITTRALTENPLSDKLSKIEYLIIRKDPLALAARGSQLSTDANFGTLLINIPAGLYKVYLVGISSLNNGSFSMLDNGSVFMNNQEFYIGLLDDLSVSATQTTFSNTLKRPVGCVKIDITDPIPTDVSYVTVYMSSNVIGMSMGGGYISETPGNKIDERFTVSNGYLNSKSLYFVPQTISSIHIRAYDASGTLLADKSVSNLTVEANKRYIVTGTLFESVGNKDFTITIDDSWDSETTIPL
ncbi:hypothetical protein [Bacteroides luti]|uniref:hypothetical protein n=1 Tax=Bacteroides luti TaxID=1297750 RepID=UPI0011147D88|nr:hypothetical protein [Bacteroides luti]